MSTNTRPSAPGAEKSYFEQQREILLSEIAVSFEHVLANINKLNRSLEGVIASLHSIPAYSLIIFSPRRKVKLLIPHATNQVGNEFSSVEALWSQFENVMGKEPEASGNSEGGAAGAQQQRGKGREEEGEYTEMGEEEEDETTRV
ncbi:dash complex subunit dad1 protein [Rutstroemia sp. NJR-2017a BBW]|nr:dash complex subunit dad1 protein [Rutstroemia sp. NJR-2017a BBW]